MSYEALGLFDAVYECVVIQMDETVRCWERTSSAEVEAFVRLLCEAQHIILAGAGRTAHLLAAVAPRFRGLGATVTMAEEREPPVVSADMTVLAACPSGNTPWIRAVAERVKSCGARFALCTGRRESPLAGLADAVLWIDAFSPGNGKPPASRQRPGMLFDQALFLVLEAVAETLEQHRAAGT